MATLILPLITIWLQVRVLPGPPAFAREAAKAATPKPSWAKAGAARELRLGKPRFQPQGQRRSRSQLKYRNQPHAKKGTLCKQRGRWHGCFPCENNLTRRANHR